MNSRLQACLGSVLLLFGLPEPSAKADPWFATGAVTRGDFNNDGSRELVVSSPQSDGERGTVYVIDLDAGSSTAWTRDTSGLAGSLFWQYVTAPYAGSDPASAPGFWDAVDLVTESQSASPSWTLTIVWPRMDDAIHAFLSGNDWVQRWRDLSANTSGGNGVYNGDTDP